MGCIDETGLLKENEVFIQCSTVCLYEESLAHFEAKKSEPYFVVTKASAKLGTNSDTTISLNICPLAEGDLRILGVRFHLRGAIWGYHKFNLTGPLLQDTRENRSKRGKCVLSHSRVKNLT